MSKTSGGPIEPVVISSQVVRIRNRENEQLVGILDDVSYSAGESKKTTTDASPAETKDLVILCHGLACTKDQFEYPKFSKELNISTFRFDFSGNGDSEGTFSYGNYYKEVEDLRSVIEFIRQNEFIITTTSGSNKVKYNVKAVIGHSKGGSIVLLYAARYDDVGLIVSISARYDMRDPNRGANNRFTPEQLQQLDDPRSNYSFVWQGYGGKQLLITKAGFEERFNLDMSAIRNIRHARVLVIHGNKDVIVPSDDAILILNELNHNATTTTTTTTQQQQQQQQQQQHALQIIDGASHSFNNERVRKKLMKTISEWLQQSQPQQQQQQQEEEEEEESTSSSATTTSSSSKM